ncbi:hypothetical protein MKX73_13980 [Solibacillus sp. FSL W7-1436]|uniref:hypothetical protein n=1 Tax=Solibacillus sp. FSL W7-1436 TaxID=2921705 RepID=UPI0030F9ABDA
MKKTLVIGNVIVSGIVVLLISRFFAGGALGEADSITPEFFFIIPLWIFSVFIMCRAVSIKKVKNTSYLKIIISNILLWLMIPIGLTITFLII